MAGTDGVTFFTRISRMNTNWKRWAIRSLTIAGLLGIAMALQAADPRVNGISVVPRSEVNSLTTGMMPRKNASGNLVNGVWFIPDPAVDPDNIYKGTNGAGGVIVRQTTDGTWVVSIPDETKYLTLDPSLGRIKSHQPSFGDGYIQMGGLAGILVVPTTDTSPANGFGDFGFVPGGKFTVNRTLPVGSTSSFQYTNEAGIHVRNAVAATSTRKDNQSSVVGWTAYGWNSAGSPPVGGYSMEALSLLSLQDLNDLTQSRWNLGVLSNGVAASWNTLLQVDLLGNAYFKAGKKVYLDPANNVFITSGTGTPEGNLTAGVGSIFLRRDGSAGTVAYVKESGSGNTGWTAIGSGGGGGTSVYVAGVSVTNPNFQGSQFAANSTNVGLSSTLVGTNNIIVGNPNYHGVVTNVVIDPLIKSHTWAPTNNARWAFGTNTVSDTNREYVIYIDIQAAAATQVTNVTDTITIEGNCCNMVAGLNTLVLTWKGGRWFERHEQAQIPASQVAGGTVNDTEFGYVDGVTSPIQTQLDGKQPLDPDLTALAAISGVQGDVIYHNGTNWTKLGAGTSGQFLKTQGTGANPVWATASGGGGSALDIDSYGTSTNATTNAVWTTTIGTNVSAEVTLFASGLGPTNYFYGHKLSASYRRDGTNAPVLLDSERSFKRSSTTPDAYFDVQSTNTLCLVANGTTNELWNWHMKGVLTSVTNGTAVASGGSYSTEVLADAPVIYYRLGEGTGTTATDTSGNSHPGTYDATGITYGVTGGVSGNTAVTFDGSHKCTTSTDAAVTPGTADFSVEVWVKTTDAGTIIAAGKFNSGSDSYWLGVASAKAEFSVANSVNSAGANAISTASVNDGNWHHIVGVKDGGTVRMYVDGSPDGIATWNTGGSNACSPTGNLVVAKLGDGAAFNFNGSLDEFAYYASKLTAGRVSAHWAAR